MVASRHASTGLHAACASRCIASSIRIHARSSEQAAEQTQGCLLLLRYARQLANPLAATAQLTRSSPPGSICRHRQGAAGEL